MIYNLYEYLKSELPSINFVVDGWENDSDIESVLLTATGGDPQHWFDRTDDTVRVLSRSNSKVFAKQRADNVYNKLKNRFGLTLPAANVGGVDYPEFIAAQISPIQSPGYIGADDNANHIYSVNFKVTIGG